LKNAENKMNFGPLEDGCECFACRHFTRAYLRHLYNVQEILSIRMLSVHNSHLFLKLMVDVRAAIAAGTFAEFHREFVANYRPSQRVLLARATAKER
jgi:queuine tRNA-ribosyltransferase